MADAVVTLDVREDLRNGGEPLPKILETVKSMEPGQSLRLLATFEPIPLFHVMAAKGFRHEARQVGAGDWDVLFVPKDDVGGADTPANARDDDNANAAGQATPAMSLGESGKGSATVESAPWPRPDHTLDNRGLMPPEPMIRVLESLEALANGEVLEVFNDREPVFLYPELAQRGYEVQTEKLESGVRLVIRRKSGGRP